MEKPLHPFLDFNALYDEGQSLSQTPEASRRRERFYNLLQVFALSFGVRGATAEIGCWRGLSSFLLCREIRKRDPQFAGAGHFIVDSFEGLSMPVEIDRQPPEARGRFGDTSVDHVRKTLHEFPNVFIVEGWVPEAFYFLPEQLYRFAHIDVDLYEPTRDCLDYFYPRMLPGGVIVVDDFGPSLGPTGGNYPGCRRAVMEFRNAHNVEVAALSTGNAVIIKRPI